MYGKYAKTTYIDDDGVERKIPRGYKLKPSRDGGDYDGRDKPAILIKLKSYKTPNKKLVYKKTRFKKSGIKKPIACGKWKSSKTGRLSAYKKYYSLVMWGKACMMAKRVKATWIPM